MSPLTFESIRDNVRTIVGTKPMREAKQLLAILNMFDAMTTDQKSELIQTIASVIDEKRKPESVKIKEEFDRIMNKGGF